MAQKISAAVKRRLIALKTEYRRARGWHYSASREMDALWAAGLIELNIAATPSQKDAAVDRLAAALAPHLAAVPITAPPAPERKAARAGTRRP